ncbi:MAG: 50S ribosomal protein L18 [Clostridia bacterium]|nr:50S ribosomal protein L18 [Clostridia bacterium]MDY5263756.1 50S ribosomal protein L18 [Eubacteriales bacterium]
MINKNDKNATRQKRHGRIRVIISGTAAVPRLNVFRSNANIYAQIINDENGQTLVAASTMEKEVIEMVKDLNKVDAAKVVGKVVAERALKAGITAVVFDRGGYPYIGRVSALADGAREAGLQF